MKISKILIITFLSWSAYDSNLFRRRGEAFASSGAAISLAGEAAAFREIKQIRRQSRDVIPPKYRRARPKLKMKVNHFSGQAADPRYSDQRKIRRRINNM